MIINGAFVILLFELQPRGKLLCFIVISAMLTFLFLCRSLKRERYNTVRCSSNNLLIYNCFCLCFICNSDKQQITIIQCVKGLK